MPLIMCQAKSQVVMKVGLNTLLQNTFNAHDGRTNTGTND